MRDVMRLIVFRDIALSRAFQLVQSLAQPVQRGRLKKAESDAYHAAEITMPDACRHRPSDVEALGSSFREGAREGYYDRHQIVREMGETRRDLVVVEETGGGVTAGGRRGYRWRKDYDWQRAAGL
jgi:hypothetical protein